MNVRDTTEMYSEGCLKGDNNLCTVVTLAALMDSDYDTCYKFMSKYGGREKGCSMKLSQIIRALGSMKRHKATPLEYNDRNRISVSRFVKNHPEGKYFVCNRNHALAIIDGVVHDYEYGGRRLIKYAVRIEKI